MHFRPNKSASLWVGPITSVFKAPRWCQHAEKFQKQCLSRRLFVLIVTKSERAPSTEQSLAEGERKDVREQTGMTPPEGTRIQEMIKKHPLIKNSGDL